MAKPVVTIVGLGLVGGSLAKDLKARGFAKRVEAIEPNSSTRRMATRAGIVERAHAAADASLRESDIVVLATPLGVIANVLRELKPYLKRGVVLTDVTGVKSVMPRLVKEALGHVTFVGAHPMAGGELGGFANSSTGLFKNKTVVMCPHPNKKALRAVLAMWRSTGAKVVRLSPQEHDRIVGLTSHLPYLVSLALVRLASSRRATGVSGKSFFDATRRAAFDPNVMAAVVAGNPHAKAMARALARELNVLADALQKSPTRFSKLAQETRTQRLKLSSGQR